MENAQEIVERIRTLIQEGRSAEEIYQVLSPLLNENPGMEEETAERLARVPHETAGRILQRMLAETRDKRVQKAIKRSLYRMRGKGIPVQETVPAKGQSILRPLEAEPPKGFGTGTDLHGERLLMLVVPHPGRRWSIMHGLVSDSRGLINFAGEEMTRREFRIFFDTFRERSPFPVVEMEASYVGFLLFQAYQLTLEKKGTPPQDYLRLKGEIEKSKREYGRPLIYSHLSLDEIASDDRWLERAGDLFREEIFTSWGIGQERIKPYADAVLDARESKLFINQNQKEARFQEIYLKALMEIFTEEIKALYKRRLEETAYVLLQMGKGEEAKISLAVAMNLEKPLNPIQPDPFLFQLVVRSINALLTEAHEKGKREPSLIVKP